MSGTVVACEPSQCGTTSQPNILGLSSTVIPGTHSSVPDDNDSNATPPRNNCGGGTLTDDDDDSLASLQDLMNGDSDFSDIGI